MKKPKVNLSGLKFNKLTVIGFDKYIRTTAYWICECECGNKKSIQQTHLKSGKTKSCGCIKKKNANYFYETNERLYNIWKGVKARCLNKNKKRYSDYGGRGIKICEEWKNAENFIQWALENGYKDNLTLERINVNGNYEPSNCKWVTTKEQAKNKRNSKIVIYDNNEYCLSDIIERLNLENEKVKIRNYITYHKLKDVTKYLNKLMEEK